MVILGQKSGGWCVGQKYVLVRPDCLFISNNIMEYVWRSKSGQQLTLPNVHHVHQCPSTNIKQFYVASVTSNHGIILTYFFF